MQGVPSVAPVRPTLPGRAAAALALGLIALAVAAAYRTSFSVPFLFDDIPSILENRSIRHLVAFPGPLEPSSATSLSGRPLPNLSFALNYALGGTQVAGYHALNLLIHVLCAWALFGLVRRTLLLPALRARFGGDAVLLAATAAFVWALHPLATESVTYLVQRVESMAALFYLTTLYCLVRSAGGARRAWETAAVLCCLFGMATKEVVATLPLAALLFDRTFLTGSFSQALRERRGFYVSLACTWLLLLFLVASTGWSRAGTAGFGSGAPLSAYWIAQFQALARYLRLSVWPDGLTFDYGTAALKAPAASLASAFLVIPIVITVAVALVRRPRVGFLAALPFIVLAPTCVVPVVTQTIAEHRVYLPLASEVVLAVIAAHTVGGRRALVGLLGAAVFLGFLTFERNRDYRSETEIWRDTVHKAPMNARAHCALGLALLTGRGQGAAAAEEFRKALALESHYPLAETELGIALSESPERGAEAIGHFRAAIRMDPSFALAHFQLGLSLAKSGQTLDAIEELRRAEALDPANADTHNNLGVALCVAGRLSDGIEEMRAALRIRPGFATAHFDLGCALEQSGRHAEAAREFETVLAIRPGDEAATQMLARSRAQ